MGGGGGGGEELASTHAKTANPFENIRIKKGWGSGRGSIQQ